VEFLPKRKLSNEEQGVGDRDVWWYNTCGIWYKFDALILTLDEPPKLYHAWGLYVIPIIVKGPALMGSCQLMIMHAKGEEGSIAVGSVKML